MLRFHSVLCVLVLACVHTCVCVRTVCVALTTAMVLWARSQDSFSINYFSYPPPLHLVENFDSSTAWLSNVTVVNWSCDRPCRKAKISRYERHARQGRVVFVGRLPVWPKVVAGLNFVATSLRWKSPSEAQNSCILEGMWTFSSVAFQSESSVCLRHVMILRLFKLPASVRLLLHRSFEYNYGECWLDGMGAHTAACRLNLAC